MAFIIFIPISIVLITGIILQLKKDVDWIQPPTMIGENIQNLSLSFDKILDISSSVGEANISSWEDVDRLDVRPNKGIVKVKAKNNWEIQIDTFTGVVIQTAYRRSDIIDKLHDGSWFNDKIKLWVFFPSGVILLGLWLTGVYMLARPYYVKLKRRMN